MVCMGWRGVRKGDGRRVRGEGRQGRWGREGNGRREMGGEDGRRRGWERRGGWEEEKEMGEKR